MNDLAAAIAERVRELMDERGLTQQQVGHALGYSQQAISDRLCGRTRFALEELYELADLFAVPLGAIVQPRAVLA